MTESEFRALAKTAYARIEAQFEDVDPDVVECEVVHLYITGSGAAGLWVGDGQGTERVFESIAPE